MPAAPLWGVFEGLLVLLGPMLLQPVTSAAHASSANAPPLGNSYKGSFKRYSNTVQDNLPDNLRPSYLSPSNSYNNNSSNRVSGISRVGGWGAVVAVPVAVFVPLVAPPPIVNNSSNGTGGASHAVMSASARHLKVL